MIDELRSSFIQSFLSRKGNKVGRKDHLSSDMYNVKDILK